jgi:hypothetical protein
MQKNRGRLNLERIIKTCSDLNKNWLLDGTGQMWEPEATGRHKIPVFSSLTVTTDNNLDLQQSTQSGNIFTDIAQNGLNFPITEQVIGWSVSGNFTKQPLQANDIAFVDLEKKEPRQGNIYLLRADEYLGCAEIVKRNGQYAIEHQESQLAASNGDFSIIGAVIGLMRNVVS